MASASASNSEQTIQSVLQDFSSANELPNASIHPFSTCPETTLASLRNLIDLTTNVAESLNTYHAMPITDTKLLTALRESSSTANKLYTVGINLRIYTNSISYAIIRIV